MTVGWAMLSHHKEIILVSNCPAPARFLVAVSGYVLPTGALCCGLGVLLIPAVARVRIPLQFLAVFGPLRSHGVAFSNFLKKIYYFYFCVCVCLCMYIFEGGLGSQERKLICN